MSNRIYGKCNNQDCLTRFMRWATRQRRKFSLYLFYRGMGHAHSAALDKVERTI